MAASSRSPVRMRRRCPRHNEDLAVADAAGLRRARDGFHHAFGQRVGHHDFKLHLGQEIDHIFGAAIQFGMALLAAKPLASVTVMPRHAL
jgi:hypothetical protein